MTYTDRSRKIFKSENKETISAKLTLPFLLPPKGKQQKIIVTKKEIKNKRKKLQKNYEKLKEKYGISTSFDKLKDFLFNENYSSHFADFYTDIEVIGIKRDMVIENTQFFQDFWNYFPHKKLDGKCPADRYREAYG